MKNRKTLFEEDGFYTNGFQSCLKKWEAKSKNGSEYASFMVSKEMFEDGKIIYSSTDEVHGYLKPSTPVRLYVSRIERRMGHDLTFVCKWKSRGLSIPHVMLELAISGIHPDLDKETFDSIAIFIRIDDSEIEDEFDSTSPVNVLELNGTTIENLGAGELQMPADVAKKYVVDDVDLDDIEFESEHSGQIMSNNEFFEENPQLSRCKDTYSWIDNDSSAESRSANLTPRQSLVFAYSQTSEFKTGKIVDSDGAKVDAIDGEFIDAGINWVFYRGYQSEQQARSRRLALLGTPYSYPVPQIMKSRNGDWMFSLHR